MKSLIAAAAVSLLAVTAAQASGIVAAEAAPQRTVELTNAREIHEAGASSIQVTVGTPKDVAVTQLPPRDRVEAGYKADASVTVSTFPAADAARIESRR